MTCRNCGSEIKGNEKFCAKCGAPVSLINSTNKNARKKVIISFAVVFVVLIGTVIAVANYGSNNGLHTSSDNYYDPDDFYDADNLDDDFYDADNLDDDFYGADDLDDDFYDVGDSDNYYYDADFNPIGRETLQYPSQDDILTYDVYKTYVEVTGSVKKDLTGELIIPEEFDNLPVLSIKEKAFGGPGEGFTTPGYSISSLVLPKNLCQIGRQAFYRCENLSSITLNNKLKSIGTWAFAYAPITSVTIPDSVTELGSGVFMCCKMLKSVILGKGMTEIPEAMFQSAESMNKIEFNDKITYIGSSAFSHTAFEKISIPNTVEEIATGAFSYMDNLSEFNFPDSTIKIGTYVLSNCNNLKKVTFGKGISSIPENVFKDSIMITDIVIPSNVTGIDNYMLGSYVYSQPTIYGEKGSEAASFASRKGLAFKLIEN